MLSEETGSMDSTCHIPSAVALFCLIVRVFYMTGLCIETEIHSEWNTENIKGISMIGYNIRTGKLLQKSLHKLKNIISKSGLIIAMNKTKVVAFEGGDPVKSKRVINNKIIGD
jgi:hypothetical protein